MPSQRDPAALKWCPWTLNTQCVSENTGNCAYVNKMQHNQPLKSRKRGKNLKKRINHQGWAVKASTAYLWSEREPAHSSSSCTVCLVFTPIDPLFLFLCIFPLPLNAWKWERWKNSAWVELLCPCWAMGAAVRKGPPCSEELAGVPKLLRFLEVAKNKVEMQGVRSIRKVGRRGIALIWSWQKLGSKCISQQGCETSPPSHLPGVGQEGRSFLLEESVLWILFFLSLQSDWEYSELVEGQYYQWNITFWEPCSVI